MREPEALIEIFNGSVLRRWRKLTDQPGCVRFPSGGSKKRVFDRATHDAATQEERVDMPFARRSLPLLEDENADHAAWPKPIVQLEPKDLGLIVVGRGADLGLAIPAGREIELIRLLRQLRDSGNSERVCSANSHAHLERPIEFLDRRLG